jgi:hypothetical protein
MIRRSQASAKMTHGQFGSIDIEPWTTLPGDVSYTDINTPHIDQLYLDLRYSKFSPSTVPILVYLDHETESRASILPVDQGNWNRFVWTEPILLGKIENGLHSIKFVTEGQDFGVADLDKFVLTFESP